MLPISQSFRSALARFFSAASCRSSQSRCILAFAERVLPRTADLWVQASLDQRQRLQQLFFPQGVAFDGNGFVGTAVTAPAFSYLQAVADGKERMVDPRFSSWNQIASWLRQLDGLRLVA
jgi:UDP-N-acetylmuramyl pentapeptide synthase